MIRVHSAGWMPVLVGGVMTAVTLIGITPGFGGVAGEGIVLVRRGGLNGMCIVAVRVEGTRGRPSDLCRSRVEHGDAHPHNASPMVRECRTASAVRLPCQQRLTATP